MLPPTQLYIVWIRFPLLRLLLFPSDFKVLFSLYYNRIWRPKPLSIVYQIYLITPLLTHRNKMIHTGMELFNLYTGMVSDEEKGWIKGPIITRLFFYTYLKMPLQFNLKISTYFSLSCKNYVLYLTELNPWIYFRLLEAHGIKILPEEEITQTVSLTEAGKLLLSSLPSPTSQFILPSPAPQNGKNFIRVLCINQPSYVKKKLWTMNFSYQSFGAFFLRKLRIQKVPFIE